MGRSSDKKRIRKLSQQVKSYEESNKEAPSHKSLKVPSPHPQTKGKRFPNEGQTENPEEEEEKEESSPLQGQKKSQG